MSYSNDSIVLNNIKTTNMDLPTWQEVQSKILTSDLSQYMSRFTPKYFQKQFNSQSFYWLTIWVQDKIAGSAWFDFENDNAILGIFLFKKFRNFNVGKYIVKKMIEEIDSNYTKVILNVRKKNESALNFYKKLGFSIVSEGQKNSGVKFYHMEKKLSDSDQDKIIKKDEL